MQLIDRSEKICGHKCMELPRLFLQAWVNIYSCSGSSWLLTQSSWVRFPALPTFRRCSGSGTGSTQPREDKWGATWKKSSVSGLENWD
jgi:hypothetical protein